jgi:hypothetical protein
MSTNDFLTKQNVDLLWEVIIDDDLFKNKPREVITQIANIFNQNLKGFYESEKNNSTNLMSMNKKFIGTMLSQSYGFITNLNKNQIQGQPQLQNKNKVSRDLITSSELQTERISQFEKELSQKQNEFTNAMTLPVPPTPKFSDNNLDVPISEMELEIKKVLDQRNYDIEQVSKNLNKSTADSWLKPQETSLKSEKPISINKPIINSNSNNQNKLKYIKIDNETIENNVIKKDIIDLNQKKNITWGENENINFQIIEEESDDDNIFKKLKKITPQRDYFSNNNVTNRLNILEDKLEALNVKMDLIINLLSQ